MELDLLDEVIGLDAAQNRGEFLFGIEGDFSEGMGVIFFARFQGEGGDLVGGPGSAGKNLKVQRQKERWQEKGMAKKYNAKGKKTGKNTKMGQVSEELGI